MIHPTLMITVANAADPRPGCCFDVGSTQGDQDRRARVECLAAGNTLSDSQCSELGPLRLGSHVLDLLRMDELSKLPESPTVFVVSCGNTKCYSAGRLLVVLSQVPSGLCESSV